MEKAGVPVTPGYHGKDQDAGLLKTKAGMIGYPVLIKAIAGGGGKGMRKVDAAKDFDDALASCMREAKSAFGDDRVLIEKYILSPRHIEVQIFGDNHGNVVHMFERDCSLQRRHQKVIEEAPAPGMTDSVRKAMTDAAIEAAQAVNYVGAGTVEFIVDGSGVLRKDGFWFMEMNTRLQVEHPVTEMITGLDLVKLQICVAQGEKLLKQKDITIMGHAVEARIYAENPSNDFLPSVGKIQEIDISGDYTEANSGVRVDTGVEEGDNISIYYDPMIAKLIGYGKDRKTALEHAQDGVAVCELVGLNTNLAFLYNTLCHPNFIAAKLETGFIANHIENLVPKDLAQTNAALALAACALCENGQHGNTPPIWQMRNGWKLNQPSAQVWMLANNGEAVPVTITNACQTSWNVHVNGQKFFIKKHAPNHKIGSKEALGYLDWWAYRLRENKVTFRRDGISLTINLFEPETTNITIGGNAIAAPMPGKIIAVNVEVGDTVKSADKLVIMEAMKMEMSLEAPRDGVVASVNCEAGTLVPDGAVLLELEEET